MKHIGRFTTHIRMFFIAVLLMIVSNNTVGQGISLLPVQDLTFTYSANMTPVNLDLSKYVSPTLPGTGPLTYSIESNNGVSASLSITGSIATITPLPTPGNVELKFKVTQGTYNAVGTIKVTVYDFHGLPGLVNPFQFPTCYDYMGPVKFTSGIKYMTNYDVAPSADLWPNSTRLNTGTGDKFRIYGFSIPLVADMDGDGYPEIIALGRYDATHDLFADYTYLDIYDGRTGILASDERLRLDMKTSGNPGLAYQWGNQPSPGIFAIVDSDPVGSEGYGKKEVIIAMPLDAEGGFPYARNIVSYEISKTKPFTHKVKWSTEYCKILEDAHHPVLQVVDFDGDGKPEILVHNKIYDANTGTLKVTLETFDPSTHTIPKPPTNEAYTGRNPVQISSRDQHVAFAYVYDLDLDGRYEVAAGGKVYYDINLSDGTYKIVSVGDISDGRTGVADMNGDGIPDVVVVNRTSDNTDARLRFYIWNPGFLKIENNKVVKNYTPNSQNLNRTAASSFRPAIITQRSVLLNTPIQGSNSYLYIGDIDGKVQKIGNKEYRLPEVAVIAGHYTYEKNTSGYHPNVRDTTVAKGGIPTGNGSTTTSASDATETFGVLMGLTMDMADNGYLKPSFVMVHKDRSGNTGFTMFDFDNDGIQEICYRDEDNLRIIKANKPFVKYSEPLGSTVIFSKTCYSYTGYEYPVIADIDNDNSADMIVIGKNRGPAIWDAYGYVYAVSKGTGDKFAPALPVWNQFMYDPFKIDPVTLRTPVGPAPNRLDPKYNFVRQTKDASGKVTSTINDYNPFNGTLTQGTKLDAQAIPKYEPVVFLTEAYIISSQTDLLKPKIVTSSNKHYIELTIGNRPSAKSDISAKTPVRVYRQNTISRATLHKELTLANLYVQGSTTNTLGASFSLSPDSTKRVWIEVGSDAASSGDVYIVRLGDDSKLVGSTWTWSFGYNGGDKYGTAYTCDDFDEGLGLANRVFRDCDWCDQVVRAARYQTLNDLYTIQEYNSVTMDVLKNDILPIVPLNGITPTKTFMDTVRLNTWNISKAPIAGYLTFNNIQGPGARITYHHDDRAILPADIDSFQYTLTYHNDVTGNPEIKTSTVYIYLLKGAGSGFSSCYDANARIELQNKPPGVSFEWYRSQYDNNKIQADGRIRNTGQMKADSTYWLKPIMSAIPTTASPGLTVAQLTHYKTLNFPRGEIVVRLVTSLSKSSSLMRWTGHVSNQWRDARNWVEVQTVNGRQIESPVNYAPAPCSNVIIPSTVNYYPELSDSAVCNNIELKDRAMLRNPHVLNYADATVEIKLKPSERDRFIMWSAPLMNMYSGDYHYRNNTGTAPQWGDVFMNRFQIKNPDNSSYAVEKNRFTATFAAVDHPLPLGTAFNLKVTATGNTRDSLLRFPRSEVKYALPNNTEVAVARNPAQRSKFITHGKALNTSGIFDMPVFGDVGTTSGRLLQIVNPYMAYLNIETFLSNNTNLTQTGYYLWDGEMGTDISAVSFSAGNRITVTNPSLILKKDIKFIPPLQSFFIAINSTSSITTVKMSPDWTTTSPSSSYTLRAATMVKSGGAMHIRLTNGTQSAHAALSHTIGAGPSFDKEDMPAVTHTIDNQTPLSLYTLSAENHPLAINSSEHFSMLPVPLGIEVTVSGEYRLEFSNLESFGYNAILVDKHQNNKQIDLRETPEYSFKVTKPSGSPTIEIANRFELRLTYTGQGITITSAEPIAPSPHLQITSGRGYIEVRSTSTPIESLMIYDSSGRRTYHASSINQSHHKISVSGRGIYIVKAIIGNERHIAKTLVPQ